ncbi:hypothetical protein [Anaerococcus sp.]|uniref:hypothetical protein n=1 Tax=Anaerococcus sp. TaxID=1872515 RepID=UPI0027B9B296|nr:hypothetical protein [Anaerococcus sp.]
MGKKVFRIIIAIIWFIAAGLCFKRNEIVLAIISGVLAIAFLYKGIASEEVGE